MPTNVIKKIDVSGATPVTTDLKGLKGATGISGFQYVDRFLHVVAEDEDVSIINIHLCWLEKYF